MTVYSQNPIDLIAKGKYHSCILTSYSIDFEYFNNYILPKLRIRGIQNVIVIVDKKKMAESIALYSDRKSPSELGYIIEGIELNRLFHPKIIQLFGNTEGMLSIGSGNLTLGSYAYSLEAWTSIHYSSKDEQSENIYACNYVFRFLNTLVQDQSSFLKGRMNNILKFTPWLKTDQLIGKEFRVENGKGVIIGTDDNILDQVEKYFKLSDVEEAFILSPFFDMKGDVLTDLKNRAPKAILNLVVDKNSVELPNREILASYSIYDIADQKNFSNYEHYKFFHAKVLYVRSKNKEAFLVGSSNFTSAGYGIKSRPNEELNVLYVFPTCAGKIQAMIGLVGLENPIDPSDLKSYPSESKISENEPSYLKKELRIISCVFDDNLLTLNFEKEFLGDILIRIYTGGAKDITKSLIKFKGQKIELSWIENDRPIVVHIESPQGQILSDKCFVLDSSSEEKACPDPEIRKIQKVILDIENGKFFLDSLSDIIAVPDFDIRKAIKPGASDKLQAEHSNESPVIDLEAIRAGSSNDVYLNELRERERIVGLKNASSLAFLIGHMKNYLHTMFGFEDKDLNDSPDAESEKKSIFLRMAQTDMKQLKLIRKNIYRFTQKDVRETYFKKIKEGMPITYQDVAFFTLVTSMLVAALKSKAIVDGKEQYILPITGFHDFSETLNPILDVLGIMSRLSLKSSEQKTEYEKRKIESYLGFLNTNILTLLGVCKLVGEKNKQSDDLHSALFKTLFLNLEHSGWIVQNREHDADVKFIPFEDLNLTVGGLCKQVEDLFNLKTTFKLLDIPPKSKIIKNSILFNEKHGFNVLCRILESTGHIGSYGGKFWDENEECYMVLERGGLIPGFYKLVSGLKI